MGIHFHSDQAIGQLTMTRPLLKYKMRNVRRCHCCQAQFLPEGFSLHILSCVVVKRREEKRGREKSQLALKANESRASRVPAIFIIFAGARFIKERLWHRWPSSRIRPATREGLLQVSKETCTCSSHSPGGRCPPGRVATKTAHPGGRAPRGGRVGERTGQLVTMRQVPWQQLLYNNTLLVYLVRSLLN